jgi:hypothetical protein
MRQQEIVAAHFRIAQLIDVSIFLKLNPGTLPSQIRNLTHRFQPMWVILLICPDPPNSAA